MTKDLISRSALLAEYDRVHVGPPGGARKLIQDAPAVETVPVRHGMWEEIRNPYGTLEGWIHRDCGRETKIKDMYCPNCGAKMDAKEANS